MEIIGNGKRGVQDALRAIGALALAVVVCTLLGISLGLAQSR
jgi:hypothetical protein